MSCKQRFHDHVYWHIERSHDILNISQHSVISWRGFLCMVHFFRCLIWEPLETCKFLSTSVNFQSCVQKNRQSSLSIMNSVKTKLVFPFLVFFAFEISLMSCTSFFSKSLYKIKMLSALNEGQVKVFNCLYWIIYNPLRCIQLITNILATRLF